jgi:5-oxopent-3-ene-1,2,5-tricarboxylate decarboxylase/2-hydroxyhepta-2,4-diene-1,7-dioate isomerase
MNPDFPLAVPPYRLSGNVYVALLNDPETVRALGPAVEAAPYKAPPRAPVLGIKPRNTLVGSGTTVCVPAGVKHLAMGPSLGIVIGRTACRVSPSQARDVVGGFLIANDISVPVQSHYRPAIRQRARDGFCPIGADAVTWNELPAEPDTLAVSVLVDGQLAYSGSTGGRVRGVAQLLADVTEFMTLQRGDLLLLGAPADAPLVGPGRSIQVRIQGLGSIETILVAEEACA